MEVSKMRYFICVVLPLVSLVCVGCVKTTLGSQMQATKAAGADADIRIKEITKKIKQTHSVSDDDLNVISSVVNDSGSSPTTRMSAIGTLMPVDDKNLNFDQRSSIYKLLSTVMTVNDSSSDPDGYAKAASCGLVARFFRDKRLMPAIIVLRKDSRRYVREMADEAWASMTYKNYKL